MKLIVGNFKSKPPHFTGILETNERYKYLQRYMYTIEPLIHYATLKRYYYINGVLLKAQALPKNHMIYKYMQLTTYYFTPRGFSRPGYSKVYPKSLPFSKNMTFEKWFNEILPPILQTEVIFNLDLWMSQKWDKLEGLNV